MMNWNILETLQHAREQALVREVHQRQGIREALAGQQSDRLDRVLVWLGGQFLRMGKFLQARGGSQHVGDTAET